MSINSTNRGWIIAVIGLLLINIVILFFFLTRDESKRPQRVSREARMTEFLKKEVGFSDDQLKQYDSLGKQHREKMKSRFDEMRAAKEKLLKDLGAAAFSDSAISFTATQSAALQKEMEVTMLQHFSTVRRICTPAQQPVFDSLIYKMISRRGGDRDKTGNSEKK